MRNLTEIEQGRFWDKVERSDVANCWLWTGAKTVAGYGKMAISRTTFYAHHISLNLDGRTRPTDSVTLHTCDNPSCVNPSHLRWGSQAENMQDAISKGRAPHTGRVAGGKNGNAKLTEADVRAIHDSTGPRKSIAERYGISASLVSHIRTERSWKHLWRES